MCSYYSCGCTTLTKIFIFADFFFVFLEQTKEITPLFLPGSCQNNQCFPKRDLWCDMRGGKAEGCRHSSRAPVVDNKWGAVLGYVLQLSRLIIFDMHSGVYTVSTVKSSPAIEGSRAQGAHTNAARTHPAHTSAQNTRASCCLFLPSPPLFTVSHLLSTAQLAALTPVSWLTSCSRWLMKKSWLLGFRGWFPINMNSPWSSCNIRPGPVFIQRATRSFVCNTQEEMKRVNSPFKMLHSIMGGTKSPLNGTSLLGFQKPICFPSPCITALCSVLVRPVLCWKRNSEERDITVAHNCFNQTKHAQIYTLVRVGAWRVWRLCISEWSKASWSK